MALLSSFKNTVLLWVLIVSTCGNQAKELKRQAEASQPKSETAQEAPLRIAANRTEAYLPLLLGKRIAVVANQTSVIFKASPIEPQDSIPSSHLIDSLLALQVDIKKVFAPEHGFRGEADAGEKVRDSLDSKTGLPIISLYGKYRKPAVEQLKNIDLVLFDIQDVGVRFYTYIATLQLVMEACAENGIPILVLDRPNPNGHYVDGPTMQPENEGFLGMTPIPLVYGMTIGEYAQMINNEGWLENKVKAVLTMIPLENWTHKSEYHVPIRPSPNLPDDVAINLYPSLGLFEGTNINAGRGTEYQFQRYGAPFLNPSNYDFTYTPEPNFGSKEPKQKGKLCYGRDLTKTTRLSEVSLQWLLDAYTHAIDKRLVFNTSGFTKHAGTSLLQQQIEAGMTEVEIKQTWQPDLEKFKIIRVKYLLYAD
ncbi:MAG: DUF1343 domain-containing protein [Maribacter sp.]|nr:DUF1343 domain-containing protein [Maribacter sp.]